VIDDAEINAEMFNLSDEDVEKAHKKIADAQSKIDAAR